MTPPDRDPPRGVVADWLALHRPRLTGQALPLDFARSREWRFRDGGLHHVTGRFFSVRGVTVTAPGLPWDGQAFPMIDQPEIGLLGFVMAPGGGDWHWLLQAKSEPGTVGWVQVGPSVQATHSNYARVHGGAPTRFLDRFIPPGASAPAGHLHSEQGTRFLGKFNGNAVAVAEAPFDPGDPGWTWAGSADLRQALGQDFVVNTDARSVIATHSWDHLRPGAALFTGPTHAPPALSDLRAQLAASARVPADGDRVAAALHRLSVARGAARMAVRPVPLDRLPGWRITADAIVPDPAALVGTAALPDTAVVMRQILGPGREVPAWDQPFLTARHRAQASLLLVPRNGVLCAVLRVADEPGFARGPEFGPTWQSDGAGPPWLADACAAAAPVLSVLQSDEGGRFLQVILRYDLRLGDGTGVPADDPASVVVPVADLAVLCQRPGTLTNEARTLVSVLLSLA
jgi:oxidase EvaA